MRLSLSMLLITGLSACVVTTNQPTDSATTQTSEPTKSVVTQQQKDNFAYAVIRVEPVAERECKARAPKLNCDFDIRVDTRPDQPPNAYQTLDKNGRPIVVFTVALIADTRNRDEIAFVLGHETAHHIEQHLARQQQSATGGALAGILIASGLGIDPNVGQQIGGAVGSRVYSKDNELEADALGTVITHKAGFNPVRGAAFFTRIPDPGDRFLGSHPPNADRIRTVKRVASQL